MRPCLDRRIGGLSEDALIEIAQDGQKAVSALLPEETSRLFAIDEVRPFGRLSDHKERLFPFTGIVFESFLIQGVSP